MAAQARWKSYEKTIHSELRRKFPEYRIRHNVRLPGLRSGAKRQIDVLVDASLAGGSLMIVVDAKLRQRPVDVKEVESFIGLLSDTGVERGMMVSASGFTRAALKRAFRDDVDLDLEVFTLADFKQWQADGAIPYSGRSAVWLSAPLGWVVDGERSGLGPARLYRLALTFEAAARQHEFMYVNFWDRNDPVDSLDKLLAKQEADLRVHSPNASIEVRDVPVRYGARGCIRRAAQLEGYPTPEITGLVEFPDAIFFAVLFTPVAVERRNVRKLEYLIQNALPISVRHENRRR